MSFLVSAVFWKMLRNNWKVYKRKLQIINLRKRMIIQEKEMVLKEIALLTRKTTNRIGKPVLITVRQRHQ